MGLLFKAETLNGTTFWKQKVSLKFKFEIKIALIYVFKYNLTPKFLILYKYCYYENRVKFVCSFELFYRLKTVYVVIHKIKKYMYTHFVTLKKSLTIKC